MKKTSIKPPSNEEVKIESERILVDIDYEKRRTIVRQRYEWVQIINDLLIGVWFASGSIFFFSESWTILGTWCFALGSMQMLIGPIIRIFQKLRVKDA